MAEVLPDLVVYDDEGRPFTVRYHLLSSLFLNELQKQHRTLVAQRRLANRQETRLARLEQELVGLKARLETVVLRAAGAVPARP